MAQRLRFMKRILIRAIGFANIRLKVENDLPFKSNSTGDSHGTNYN